MSTLRYLIIVESALEEAVTSVYGVDAPGRAAAQGVLPIVFLELANLAGVKDAHQGVTATIQQTAAGLSRVLMNVRVLLRIVLQSELPGEMELFQIIGLGVSGRMPVSVRLTVMEKDMVNLLRRAGIVMN